MKKKVIIPIFIIILLIVVSYLIVDIILGFGYKINIVDGKPAGLVQYHDEDYYIQQAIRERAIVIRDGESRTIFKLSDLGVDVSVTGYYSNKYTIDTQNMAYEISTESIVPKIRDYLEERVALRTCGTVGHFEVIKDEVIIVDSEVGNVFDIDAIISYVVLRINNEDIISIDVDDYVVAQEDSITEQQDKLSSILDIYSNFSICYTDGFEITKEILSKYGLLKVTDESIDIVIDEDKIVKMLVKNLTGYNSIGIDRRFHTHDGKDITVSGGTYGDYIDYSSEAKELVTMFESLESATNRIPIMKQKAKFSLDTTYIEVDKTKQHIYYYEDGELVLDSDVVTGKPTSDRMTPSGVYFILNKTTDANLIGATWNVKSDRWMGVTYQGVGFHDASWRSSFGGEIYKSNGSHGCINTPKDAMFKLYDMVEEGTPVVIY